MSNLYFKEKINFSIRVLSKILAGKIILFFLFVYFYLGGGSYEFDPSMGLPVYLWLLILIIFNFIVTLIIFVFGYFNCAIHMLISSTIMVLIAPVIFLMPFEIYSSNYLEYQFRFKNNKCALSLTLTENQSFSILQYMPDIGNKGLYTGNWFNIGDTTKFLNNNGEILPFFILNQKLYEFPEHPIPIQLYKR